jgi:hypothetical protein
MHFVREKRDKPPAGAFKSSFAITVVGKRSRGVVFLGEHHEKACRFGLHQLRNCFSRKRLSDKRDKTCSSGYSFSVRFFNNLLVLDGQPEGRASTPRLLAVGGECAEGGKLFERSIDAFAIDVAIEETTDLVS